MYIKRREFVRRTALLGIASGFYTIPLSASNQCKKPISTFLLKGFRDEQEESPALVSTAEGEMWMFSLRRLAYPEDKELVSAFKYNGKTWTETAPVTPAGGRYEALAAQAAPDGRPMVAWNSIEDGKWKINAAQLDKAGNWKAYQFPDQPGKPVNPVLHTPNSSRAWISWENYYKGKFSIFISKFERGSWSYPVEVKKTNESCFYPAIAEDVNGDLYVAYDLTDHYHRNIEMALIDGQSLRLKKTIPVAIGGVFENRVNINTKPALSFDNENRLWISYESNRNASRLDDSDNYTGDRCCAILSYQNGVIAEVETLGKWLFEGRNDHRPTFIRDHKGTLHLATHCGGDFQGNPYWKYRISSLDEHTGWTTPTTILESEQKGVLISPSVAFHNNYLWLATLVEKTFDHEPSGGKGNNAVRSRLTQLKVYQRPALVTAAKKRSGEIKFTRTQVEEFHNVEDFLPVRSGRAKTDASPQNINGKTYSLLYGNLHEHSENSSCWPAGTEGTLHDEYRFGMYAEGYNFMGITDHGYTMNEVYWRKNNRLADFYNDPPFFVALHAMEWTLSAQGDLESVYGAGHYNIVFASTADARKFIRNSQEIYNVNTPESKNPVLLWKLLKEKQIDCITIPHHPAAAHHPIDWHVHDPDFVPVVEIFQCRGNAEYPGCPREIQAKRHVPTTSKRAFIDYALLKMKYKMGFIASGDHNNIGLGVAALWVKDFSRNGILEAMRNRHCFATTGDKMMVDFSINGTFQGATIQTETPPVLQINIKGQHHLEKVEILRNSKVVKVLDVDGATREFNAHFTDEHYQEDHTVTYYYIRATQKNNEIAWSSPIWVEQA